MISVIIPVYNVEKYIERCLISLENQTFQDFEVILIDDGSPDNSTSIIENYLKHSSLKIKFYHIKNSGVSAARNYGISKASGDFICFVDSDDTLNLDYLRTMYNCITLNNVGVCICRSQSITENDSNLYSLTSEYTTSVLLRDEALKKLLYGQIKAGIWTLLIRKDCLEDNRFAEGYKYSEDLQMVWKLVASCKSLVYIHTQLYNYRIREGSAMTKIDENRLDGMVLFQKLEPFLKIKAPSFYLEFKKYGVAYWVWSTLWQEVLFADKYTSFMSNTQKYDPLNNMKKLRDFPIKRVQVVACIYIANTYLYYNLIKCYKFFYKRLNKS